MKARELLNMGYKQGPVIGEILSACKIARSQMSAEAVREVVRDLRRQPELFYDDEIFGKAAMILLPLPTAKQTYEILAPEDALRRYRQWGAEFIDDQTRDQMTRAVQLPCSVGGALMPDAHLGYGIPIGGVWALKDAVCPMAVGVDIACRMMLTIIDIKTSENQPDPIQKYRNELRKAIEKHTRFGQGAAFARSGCRQDDVMDKDWGILKGIVDKDQAWLQLGSSGGGNHFVDIGIMEFPDTFTLSGSLQIPSGRYMAILSHSGSRGAGLKVANYFSKIAGEMHPDLPKQHKHLAWLPMDTDAGRHYWDAMTLMGEYASANHHCIHRHLLKELKFNPILQVENHHNFAWKEQYCGEELIIHRKGATPAGKGILGVIPGSMTAPGFLVIGKGNVTSFNSASHGAGRTMSRRAAKESITAHKVRELTKAANVEVISAGLDEAPHAYKDAEKVMEAQKDLVEIQGRFYPRLVKMADDGYVED